MTEFEDADVPDFDDGSYAEIRALLADAAATEPIPAEVAAGLDDVLAGLVAERAAEPDSTVVPIRRRALVARRLLVAAAAVVLVGAGGVGVSQVLQNTNEGNDSTASHAGVSDLAPEAPAPSGGRAESGNPATLDTRGNLAQAYSGLDRSLSIQFTRAKFAQQVTRLSKQSVGAGPWFDSLVPKVDEQSGDMPQPTDPDAGSPPADTGSGGTTSGEATRNPAVSNGVKGLNGLVAGCTGPPATDGVVVLPITFEGNPATLAVHPVVNGSRYIAAWSCDGHWLLAYTTVPG